jgi:hypothetical protein
VCPGVAVLMDRTAFCLAISAAAVSHKVLTGTLFLLLAIKQPTAYLRASPLRLNFQYFAERMFEHLPSWLCGQFGGSIFKMFHF